MACPVRSYMESGDIKWRYGRAPNYDKANQKYLKERQNSHKADSLEKLVENIVKTFEMEATHKLDYKDWGTIADERFSLWMNGTVCHTAQQVTEIGTYNALLQNCPFYDARRESFESSHQQMKSCFPGGFAWELLELHSGPPKVTFTWRHWAHFEGFYHDTKPTGELLEVFGSAVATVNKNNKMEKLEVFFDPNLLFFKLSGGKLACKI